MQPYGSESQGEPGKNAENPGRDMLLLPLGFISEASFEIISATDLIRVMVLNCSRTARCSVRGGTSVRTRISVPSAMLNV